MLKIFTVKDILSEPIDNSCEMSYRDGYYDGVDQVIEALESGVTLRQIKAWHNVKIFNWRYRDRTTGFVIPPKVSKPWKILRKEILGKFNSKCVYCGEPANHVDHVIPLSRGGTDDEDNLVAACSRCNINKNNKMLDEWNMPFAQ